MPTNVHTSPLPHFHSSQAPHWDTAVALDYSRTGSHFAGLGEGGLVAVWRQDRIGAGGIGYADWAHHVRGEGGGIWSPNMMSPLSSSLFFADSPIYTFITSSVSP